MTQHWRRSLDTWVQEFADAQVLLRRLEHDIRVLRKVIEFLAESLSEDQLVELANRFDVRHSTGDHK